MEGCIWFGLFVNVCKTPWYEVLVGGMCYGVVTYTTLAMTVAFG